MNRPQPATRPSALRRIIATSLLLATAGIPTAINAQTQQIPHLQKNGRVTQLMVGGEPFLVLGGELFNSSSSSLDFMQPLWDDLRAMNLNTVLAPVSWALIEPAEGRFDFAIVDGLIAQARQNDMKLVLLWFGSWKNTWSGYIPDWMKRDFARFPRVYLRDGTPTERLTPLSDVNRDADAHAFAALMRHLKRVDGRQHTVIMVQVQNEVGVIPDARDHSPTADAAYNAPVPQELMEHLLANRETVAPELRERWLAAGFKHSGSWEAVFGAGLATEDLFMAWHYARYIGKVAEAGKAEYPLPMFANAALIRTNYAPGQYNSGGPLPHSADVWRAGAPQLDFLAPDIYFGFKEWTDKYVRNGNPLFVPEMVGEATGAANVFYAIGHHSAIGTAPFGIDGRASGEDAGTAAVANSTVRSAGAADPVARSYGILGNLAPLILQHQTTGNVAGVVLEPSITRSQKIILGGYELDIRPEGSGGANTPVPHGIFINSAPDEFFIGGDRLAVFFRPAGKGRDMVGLATVEEGRFVDGKWICGRVLAGDDTGQGNNLSLGASRSGILRVVVYKYR